MTSDFDLTFNIVLPEINTWSIFTSSECPSFFNTLRNAIFLEFLNVPCWLGSPLAGCLPKCANTQTHTHTMLVPCNFRGKAAICQGYRGLSKPATLYASLHKITPMWARGKLIFCCIRQTVNWIKQPPTDVRTMQLKWEKWMTGTQFGSYRLTSVYIQRKALKNKVKILLRIKYFSF